MAKRQFRLPGNLPPRELALLAALPLMVIIAYWPAFFADFVWDDKVFLDVPVIMSFSGLKEIWFTPGSLEYEGHYWPLVYTTIWLEHKLWGFNPFPFHLTNILLHCANTLLLMRLLMRMQVPGAWLIAAIFALHPVHVEAVAWVIARKDLLATLFYLLAAGCWLRFRQAPRAGAYLTLLALFTAGMLSKSFVITLPASLLVWVWWQQGQVAKRDLMQVAPMLLLGFAIVAYDLSHYSTRAEIDFDYTIVERLIIVSKALWFYAGKLLWPEPLLTNYPLWNVSPAQLLNWLYLPAAAALALGLWLARQRIGRGPLAGALFFAITLSPMLGFGDNSFMQFSFVADRYQYLAGTGLVAVLVAALVSLCRQLPANALHGARALAALLLLGLGALTYRYAQTFHDEIALFNRVIDYNPEAHHVYFNLGNALMKEKRLEEAAEAFAIAIKKTPETANIHINLGVVRLEQGRYQEAEKHLRQAVALDPDEFQAQQNLAAALRRMERFDESLAMMKSAARLLPAPPARHYYYMALDAMKLNRQREAERYFRKVLQANPGDTDARGQLLMLYLDAGRYDAAQQLVPNLPQVLNEMAYNNYNEGNIDQTLKLYQHQLAIEPDNPSTLANLGAALAQAGRYQEAIERFEQALALDPQQASALNYLPLVRQRLNAAEASQ